MTTNSISFPYVNGTEIPVSENCLYLNSSWVHSSKDGKWDTHFVWELNVIQKFVDQIQDNFVILDIGANNGSFSLAAKFYQLLIGFVLNQTLGLVIILEKI